MTSDAWFLTDDTPCPRDDHFDDGPSRFLAAACVGAWSIGVGLSIGSFAIVKTAELIGRLL